MFKYIIFTNKKNGVCFIFFTTMLPLEKHVKKILNKLVQSIFICFKLNYHSINLSNFAPSSKWNLKSFVKHYLFKNSNKTSKQMHESSTNKHVRDHVPLIEFVLCSNILLLPRVYPLSFSCLTDNSIITDNLIEIIINGILAREISVIPHAWISFFLQLISSYI